MPQVFSFDTSFFSFVYFCLFVCFLRFWVSIIVSDVASLFSLSLQFYFCLFHKYMWGNFPLRFLMFKYNFQIFDFQTKFEKVFQSLLQIIFWWKSGFACLIWKSFFQSLFNFIITWKVKFETSYNIFLFPVEHHLKDVVSCLKYKYKYDNNWSIHVMIYLLAWMYK